jgi:hypothetical protein
MKMSVFFGELQRHYNQSDPFPMQDYKLPNIGKEEFYLLEYKAV